MEGKTLAEIGLALSAEVVGDKAYKIFTACEPTAAGVGDLALAMDEKFLEALQAGNAEVAVLWPGADWKALGLKGAIFVQRPRYAMAGVTAAFENPPGVHCGIHPSAVVDPSTTVGENASIAPMVVVGPDVVIGKNARIMAQVTIAENARIGDDCLLHSGTRIGSRVQVGNRFIAHQNSVVGSDGFSFVTPEAGAVEQVRREFKSDGESKPQQYARIASIASVKIGDDVELGACSTIDKGTVAPTTVGNGTKIDNHVQIGHNVSVGENCLLCAHVAVAGSTILGNQVVLGGQAGVGDHLVIGDNVIAGGASAILSNVPKGRVVMGYPATKMEANIESYKAIRRLPRLISRVAELEKQVSKTVDND